MISVLQLIVEDWITGSKHKIQFQLFLAVNNIISLSRTNEINRTVQNIPLTSDRTLLILILNI